MKNLLNLTILLTGTLISISPQISHYPSRSIHMRESTASAAMLTVNAQAKTYYVATNGKSTNSGSISAPLDAATIFSGTSPVRTGDMIVFTAGIYRISSIQFGPAGINASRRTIFKSAPNSRVIFTTADDKPPSVRVKDYVRLQGLWFGGRQSPEADNCFCPGGTPIGRGKQIINCTIFGYREGTSQGSAEYMLYKGNRYVRSGREKYQHAIYLSGGYTPGKMSQHAIVDNNIIIAGNAYGINGWHYPHSNIITRNFFAASAYGISMQGSDHLIANNFFWKMKGYPGKTRAWGAFLPGNKILFYNNIMGPEAGILQLPPDVGADNVFANNAFLDVPPKGDAAVILQLGNERTQLGISAADIDNTIANLESAFSEPVQTIYNNTLIEPAFARLKLLIPNTSPLYRKGKRWFGTQTPNIGPNAPVPANEDGFWQAFHELGLQDFDRFGQAIQR